jgi:transposase-like protein
MFAFCSRYERGPCYPPAMPSTYARNLRALKGEIVARVEAGERLRAVSAAPGMPCAHTVRNWAAADRLFADELARARRVGDWRRAHGFDEARAAAFLARARAGARIHELLREPGMPGRGLYDRWRAGQAPFAEATFELRARSNLALGELGRARRRPFDQALADRIIVGLNSGARLEAVLAADPELPCRPTLRRWRREAPEFDRVLKMIFAAWRSRGGGLAGGSRRARRVPEAVRGAVCEAIEDGGSFASLARDGFASRATLRRWYRADPDFAEAVDGACAEREATLDFELWLAAEQVPPGPVKEMNRAVAPITRAIARLRHRPGAVHRRRGGAGATAGAVRAGEPELGR